MSATWVIVADASRARIFEKSGTSKEIHERETFSHPESRLHERDLTSDLPGRAFDSEGAGRHAMGAKHDPKQNETLEFARQLAEHIEKARSEKRFGHLNIIAAPAMLGDLRDALSDETRKLVTTEIDKDLTQHSIEDIQQHLTTS
jgi:protein required for attachment to host cells